MALRVRRNLARRRKEWRDAAELSEKWLVLLEGEMTSQFASREGPTVDVERNIIALCWILAGEPQRALELAERRLQESPETHALLFLDRTAEADPVP
jgi:hypothetical protein